VPIAAFLREKKGIPRALDALGRFRRAHPTGATIAGSDEGTPASRKEEAQIASRLADIYREIA
jgi:hypothetical protein